MTSVILRFLSGPQNGVRIELTDGTWVFGRDDSCDLIFADDTLAPRHAIFTVQDGRVSISPLDGIVKNIDGSTIDGDFPPGTAALIGASRFAWGPADADETFWQQIDRTAPVSIAALKITEAAPVVDPDEKAAAAAAPDTPPVASRPKALRWAVIAAAIVLFCTGVGTFVFMHSPVQQASSANSVTPSELARLTRNAGFKNVKTTLTGDFIRFKGSVKDDAERGRLVKFARLLPYASALEVSVDTDSTEPLKSAFNTQDYWPEVTLVRRESPQEVLVSGYIISSAAEEKAFEQARTNLADPDIAIRRKILHREEVSKLLFSAFKQTGATDARVEFLPGRIRVTAVFTPDRKKKLDQSIELFEKNCPVPVAIDLFNAERSTAAKSGGAVATDPVDPMKPQFRVTGVSGGTLKFVKLAGGEKVFTGGVLPGGFILESVNYDRLVLTKNHQRIIYPLKVTR